MFEDSPGKKSKHPLFKRKQQRGQALYPEVKNVSFIQLTITPAFVKITTTNALVGGTELVSNIGGGLGLTLGLSILSVMDYFLEKIIPK